MFYGSWGSSERLVQWSMLGLRLVICCVMLFSFVWSCMSCGRSSEVIVKAKSRQDQEMRTVRLQG